MQGFGGHRESGALFSGDTVSRGIRPSGQQIAAMLDIAAACTIESQPNLSLAPLRQLPQ
jgi:hypothetical protein